MQNNFLWNYFGEDLAMGLTIMLLIENDQLLSIFTTEIEKDFLLHPGISLPSLHGDAMHEGNRGLLVQKRTTTTWKRTQSQSRCRTRGKGPPRPRMLQVLTSPGRSPFGQARARRPFISLIQTSLQDPQKHLLKTLPHDLQQVGGRGRHALPSAFGAFSCRNGPSTTQKARSFSTQREPSWAAIYQN